MSVAFRLKGDVECYRHALLNMEIQPLTLYAAPTTQGTGDGLSAANAATLETILTTMLQTATYTVVKLASGSHILSSTVTIDKYFYLRLEATAYDSLDPPIICTTHSTGTYISEITTGSPQPSQTCTAHGYDEFPLLIKNSQVVIDNVWFHGTRNCIKCIDSHIELLGETNFKLWAYSLSSTEHDGQAIYAQRTQIVGDDTNIAIDIFHPQYTAITDTITLAVTPIYITDNSSMVKGGEIIWTANTQTNVPRVGSNPISYHQSSINVYYNSKLSINLSVDNVVQVFHIGQSHLKVVLTQIGTGKLFCVINGWRLSEIWISINGELHVDNSSGVNVYDAVFHINGSSVHVDSGSITMYGLSKTVIFGGYNSSVIYSVDTNAENRNNNLGSDLIAVAYRLSKIALHNTHTTRNSGTDKIVNASEGSDIYTSSTSLTSSSPNYAVSSGGRYIESDGTVHTT
jgi:hypothetical protein